MKRSRSLAPILLGLVLALAGVRVGAEATPPGEGAATEPATGPATATSGEPAPGPAPGSPGEAEAPATGPSDASPRVLRRPPGEMLLRQAWSRSRDEPLAERVDRVRSAALALGIRDLDDAARALLLDGSLGDALARAEAAALLAPDLPAAHAARASALLTAGSPVAAVGAVLDAWSAHSRHLEASLWMRATLHDVAARAALGAGLGFLLLVALRAAPAVVRGLSRVAALPRPSAAALLAAVVLAPVALGEGMLGLACGATLLAGCGAGWLQRGALALASGLVFAGLFPLAGALDAELRTLPSNPLLEAVHRAERGLASPVTLARLEYAEDHPLSQRALALAAKRQGDLGEADRRFREQLEAGRGEPELLANAANVRLALGALDEAISLYEEAALIEPSPLLLFNLSQAYGRTIRLDDQDRVLARAQEIDADAVRSLTSLAARGEGLAVVDLALPPRALVPPDASAGSLPALRARFAPGWLGGTPARASLALGGLLALGLLTQGASGRLLAAGESADEPATDPAVRMSQQLARRAAFARRERFLGIASLWVPGLAALEAERPLLALATTGVAAGLVVCLLDRGGVVPDPLAVGATGGLALLGMAGLGGALYAVLTLAGLALRGRS